MARPWLSLGFIVLAPLMHAQEPRNWPSFRGDGSGRAAAVSLPLTWSPKENLAWKIDLPGYGQSVPTIWNDHVFVTSVRGEERETCMVIALDAATGKMRWTHEFQATQKSKWSHTISRAAPTPAIEGESIYAFFEGGDVVALDHQGKVRWTRSLVKEFGEFQGNHGMASSPAIAGDAVLILVDHAGPSYLIAFSKQTGKTLWKTDRKNKGSWTSPTIAKHDGRTLAIVSSNGSASAYDVADGKLLWTLDGLTGNTIPSASVLGDTVLLGAGRKGETPAKAPASNCCLKLTMENGQPSFKKLWSATKATSGYATPLIHAGHAYFITDAGVVHCLDATTGEERYNERLDGICWASPIACGDRVYFFSKIGKTSVVKTGPTFERLANNELWDSQGVEPGDKNEAFALYGAAAADGSLFLRTGSTLTRIGKR